MRVRGLGSEQGAHRKPGSSLLATRARGTGAEAAACRCNAAWPLRGGGAVLTVLTVPTVPTVPTVRRPNGRVR